jgi:hypothetical protein
MRWKSFAVALAVLFAVPLSAQAAGNPKAQWFAGAVTASSPSSLTVDVLWSKGSLSGTQTVAIGSATKIVYGKHQTSIDPGDLVRVVDANGTARRIHVNCNCHFAAGTVASISAGTLSVNVTRSGPYDTVLKGNDVTFQIGSATLPSLTAGAKVAVRFSATGFFKDPSFNWQTATFTIEHARKAKK